MGVKNGLATALNALRQEASSKFQEVVPIVDENTSIEAYSAPLLNTPKFMNEFCDVLVQRIIYTQLETKVFKNPLKVLEGDRIPLGYLGQEIFINPAEGRDYDVNDFAGALKKYESDTKVQYMYINFDKQYPVTLIKQSLKQAFVSWNALEEYIAGLTNSLYNGYYIDEYKNTKALAKIVIDEQNENMELAIKYYKFINNYAKVKKLKLNIKIIKNFKKENIIVYS